ncbi:hypothetical protein DV736_g2313, partial [Chaetothyriales sp. CBS 134916]
MGPSSLSEYEAVNLSDFPSSSDVARAPLDSSDAIQRQLSKLSEYSQPGIEDNYLIDHSPRDLGNNEAVWGLDNAQERPRSIQRKPVGSHTLSPKLANPPSQLAQVRRRDSLSQATTQQNTPAQSGDWESVVQSAFTPQRGYVPGQDYSSEANLLSNAPGQSQPAGQTVACPTEGDILTSPWSWYAVPILIMSVYSSAFSAIFLGIAVAKPRWGERIGTNSSMTYATATLLSALFSKTVELSFVAVFVALLGQMLSRRAIAKPSRRVQGVNLSEMTMRQWVTQPGTLITHLHFLRYAALTLLGALVLLATVAGTFYTTAAEALVAPKLKFGPTQHRVLGGTVAASFANSPFLQDSCQTPINIESNDPDEGKPTCLQISYAAQAYHNFQTYFTDWGNLLAMGDTLNLSSLSTRPLPFAMLNDNITVTGQWITPSGENITRDSLRWGRLVENITMAMPHANVVNAATDPYNHILQPSELEGSGEYYLSASVPAPTLNILCVGLSKGELEPLIYEKVPNPPGKINPTAVDDIFGFNQSLLISPLNPPPQFSMMPADYNTITNASKTYGTDAVWTLAKPVYPNGVDEGNTYILCSVKTQLYPHCTTNLHVTVSGGELSVHCDHDPENTIPYSRSLPTAPDVVGVKDWKDIGLEWQGAISLNGGVANSNDSISRLLTQFVPPYNPPTTTLPTFLPSIGEALGVLAGCTALMASENSPFVHYWNYSTDSILKEPQVQYFNATVKYMDYASGGSQAWQGIFYPILVAVFVVNIFALVYFLKNFIRDGQVTDYTEPQNLFALALMSAPSRSFSGSCGAGPRGKMLGTRWRVDMLGGGSGNAWASGPHDRYCHPHFYVKCPDDEYADWGTARESDRKRAKRKAKSRPKSMADGWGEHSPAVEQYRRLAGWM